MGMGRFGESVDDKGRSGSVDGNLFTSQYPERLVRDAACEGSVGEGCRLSEG